MRILLNNNHEIIDKEYVTVSELLEIKNFTFKMLVVKINSKLVKKVNYDSAMIKDGDEVTVFNHRGEMIIYAKVTERIMPGVVGIEQGVWYDPDERGV
ncbi:MAG: MoaD/ThiS family protein, partial [Bacteroidetes bacterium]|nr:MoaD/ThiS family protein [Bacteroidota bacterium]